MTCEAAFSAVASASVTPVGSCPRFLAAGSVVFEDTVVATAFPSIAGETCAEPTAFGTEGPLAWGTASLAPGLAMGALTGLGELLLPDGEPAFPSVFPSFCDVSEDDGAPATSGFAGAGPSLFGAFWGDWGFISPCGRGGADTTNIGATSTTAFRCSGNAEMGTVLASLVPALCAAPSRDGSLVSAVALEGDGSTAEEAFMTCPPEIKMGAISLPASCLGISRAGAGIDLLSPGGVGKTGAATCGLIARAKTSVGTSGALKNSAGTETGGGTAGVDGTSVATTVEDVAAGSDLPAVADGEGIFVLCSPRVTMVATRSGGFPRGISVGDAAIGSLSPDGVGRTGVGTSGLALDVGATLVGSGRAFPSSGGIETGGGRGGLGGSAGANSAGGAAT